MDDVIKNLTPEQALAVLRRLSDKQSGIRDAVLAEAMNVLNKTDSDDVAEDVYIILDAIDVHDCWDRAGRSRDGYTSPEEAAVELIEEELQPYFDQVARYHELDMSRQESAYCKGVILSIYRYAHESKSEFRDWADDLPLDCAGSLLDEWRERCQNPRSKAAMDDFIRERCPKWAKYLIRTAGKV